MVISIIDAGRKAGWKDVRREFTNREIAEMCKVGLDPTNGSLIGVLKGVNDEHFESLDQNSWEGVVDMTGKEDYVDKQTANAKLSVDALVSLQKQYDKVTGNQFEFEAALTAEAAEYATQVAAEQVYAAAEKAAVEAHHAAVEATSAAKWAAHKAEFIATAMAEGVSREDAERLAAEAGH